MRALGLYNRAYSLARIPSDQFAESIGPFLLSSLARVQDDVDASRTRWLKALTAIGVLTYPFLVVLAVVGPAVVEVLYGPAWAEAGVPLQVMVIGAMFLVPASVLRSLINAQGLVGQLVPVNLFVLVATVLAVIALAPLGIVGIALGISAREMLLFGLLARVARLCKVDIRLVDMLHALLPSLGAASAAFLGGEITLALLSADQVASELAKAVFGGATVLLVYGLAMLAIMRLWRGHAPLSAVTVAALDVLGRVMKRARGHA
jgi:PST family polysaccharide transporter